MSPPFTPRTHKYLAVQQPDPASVLEDVAINATLKEEAQDRLALATDRHAMDDYDQHNRHRLTIERLEAAVKQWEHSLKCNPAYGKVFAKSGYRVDETAVEGFSSGCSLDWGAVEVDPTRAGSNEVRFTPPAVVASS